MTIIRYSLSIILLSSLIFGGPVFGQEEGSPSGEAASAADSLRQAIDSKNVELQTLLEEREKIEKQLEETGAAKNSLQKELKTIDGTISHLNLSIKANKLTLEKLNLEIQSLGGEIESTESKIENKKNSIARLFVELQQKDRENLLLILLRNKTLAESVSETQSITTLQSDLLASAEELRDFQGDLVQKLNEEENKKAKREAEQRNLVNRQAIAESQKGVKNTVLTQTKNQEKIYQEQITELDKRQEEISRIIEEFEETLRASFDPSLLPLKRPGVLAFPVEEPIIVTQFYGPTKFAQRAYRSKVHNGMDFRAPLGTPIYTVHDGEVTTVDNNDRGTSRWNKYQYGLYVLIKHDNNLSSLYAHLSRAIVKRGETVKRGDLIGYSGNTGYSFGPHIHLTVLWTPSVSLKSIPPAAGLVPIGVTINPTDYLPKGAQISKDAN